MYKQPDDTAAAAEALKFFDWAYDNGDKMAEELDYIPMPDNVVAHDQEDLGRRHQDADGKPVCAQVSVARPRASRRLGFADRRDSSSRDPLKCSRRSSDDGRRRSRSHGELAVVPMDRARKALATARNSATASSACLTQGLGAARARCSSAASSSRCSSVACRRFSAFGFGFLRHRRLEPGHREFRRRRRRSTARSSPRSSPC